MTMPETGRESGRVAPRSLESGRLRRGGRMGGTKRVVIKVGSATLTDADGRLDRAYISDLCRQIAVARRSGWAVVLVTSGAIRAGSERLNLKRRPHLLPVKQAAAAVGQGLLLQMYTGELDTHSLASAQVLLTREDFSERRRYLNARNTLMTLLRFGAIPIINENDTVSVDEIRFGDNDKLAALVGTIVDADVVMLLTDVPGLCRKKPRPGRPAEVIPVVEEITDEIMKMAEGGESARGGTGGMTSKLDAARVAMASGVDLAIVPGRMPDVVLKTLKTEGVGTRFISATSRMSSRKRWIAFAVPAHGTVRVNANASRALLKGHKSLLPVGVTDVRGDFESGDLVRVIDEDGIPVARGFVNYSSEEVRMIMGKKSSEIKRTLGHKEYDELIHCDNLVVGI